MFEDSYNEYIRSVLGYPNQGQQQSMENMSYEYNEMPYQQSYLNSMNPINASNEELEECYPEIYKIVYPMVTKACSSNNRGVVTKDLLERLTDEIYFAVEDNDEINVNINLGNEIQNNAVQTNNRNENKTENRNIKDSREIKEARNDRSIKEERQKRNSRPVNRLLRDLIKILLLRELTGRQHYHNRPPIMPPPPFPGGPSPRPPFPGGPHRPPMRPRLYEDQYDGLYEN